jgi:hypothetical protein
MHHGKFTTMREAILEHSGEALSSRRNFEALPAYDRDCLIEFLKVLQILPHSASRSDRQGGCTRYLHRKSRLAAGTGYCWTGTKLWCMHGPLLWAQSFG